MRQRVLQHVWALKKVTRASLRELSVVCSKKVGTLSRKDAKRDTESQDQNNHSTAPPAIDRILQFSLSLRSSLAESSPSFLKTVQHVHMPSANEIKSLFRAYLRLGRNFPNYNIRQ